MFNNGFGNYPQMNQACLMSESDMRTLQNKQMEMSMYMQQYRDKKAVDFEFDIHKAILNDQLDARKVERREEARKSREINSAVPVVTISADGVFIFARGFDGTIGKGKEVFPKLTNFRAKMFTSQGVDRAIMEVSFDRGRDEFSFWIDPNKHNSVKVFETKLKSKAVSISVGRIYREDVLGQVLMILIDNSSTSSLPRHHGFNKHEDGSFIFTGINKTTFEEVLKYVD